MQSRNLLNLFLLLGVGALVLFLVLDSGEKTEPAKPKLTQLDAANLTHIKITRPGLRDVVLEKINNHWQMTRPFNMPASKFRVDALLKLASADVQSSHTLDSLKLKNYALDTPKGTIIFNHSTKLEFGSTDPIKNRRYIKQGNTLNLVADTFYYLTRSLATEFVDEQLIPQDKQITALQLPTISVALQDNKWTITPEPKNYIADVVAELVNEWQNSRAMDIKEYDTSKNNKKILTTDIVITLDNKGQTEKINFSIITNKDEFTLVRQDHGLQYIFPASQKQNLLALPAPIEADKKPADAADDSK